MDPALPPVPGLSAFFVADQLSIAHRPLGSYPLFYHGTFL